VDGGKGSFPPFDIVKSGRNDVQIAVSDECDDIIDSCIFLERDICGFIRPLRKSAVMSAEEHGSIEIAPLS
jgi:hypothetical protein